MFWTVFTKGDFIIQFTAFVLVLASITTWVLVIYKSVMLKQMSKAVKTAPAAFWASKNFEEGTKRIVAHDSSGVMLEVLRSTAQCVQMQGVSGQVPLQERLDRALRIWLENSQAKIDVGMTALATITSAAPFVGLFGTVWGIYSALISLSTTTQNGLLDKISGPIGEALIMTAVGLAVAIPSLIAYNVFSRWSRSIKQDIEGFVSDMHGYAMHNTAELARVKVEVK